jgi:hypothetical protein
MIGHSQGAGLRYLVWATQKTPHCVTMLCMARRLLLMAALVLLVGTAAAGLRTAQVHADTGEWRLSPSSTPSVIHVDGRDYHRAGLVTDPQPVVFDVQPLGRTPGGAVIYVPPTGSEGGATPTVLHVFDDPQIWAYELIGGP